MRWEKLGRLRFPQSDRPWARSHAMVPTPLAISDGMVRIYTAHLDEHSVARVGYADVALAEPTRVLAVAQRPVLDVGEPGMFDDNGVNACCVAGSGGTLRMYYVGYQQHRKIPYTLFTGLAMSDGADGPFRRRSASPVLDRVEGELFFRTAPFVLQEGGRWRMWYVGGSTWLERDGKQLPSYSLRHIESADGIAWSGPGMECLAPVAPQEIGFGRPFVLRDGPIYRMWYSIRSADGYRLGYATSSDGLQWIRADDEAGIVRSTAGWDSEMVCYAAVLPAAGRWLMFYNGNGYGRTGIGVAAATS